MPFIRRERSGDSAAIRQVHELAFGRPAEADLVDVLRARGKATLSLVAVQGDRVVGHILFSPVTIESAERTFRGVGLAPMAVLPERQRQGIGSRLVKAGLVACRNAGYDCVVVLGHPTYYPRFGFVPASRYGITSEYEAPDEAFMVLPWCAGIPEPGGGVARYQPEFGAARAVEQGSSWACDLRLTVLRLKPYGFFATVGAAVAGQTHIGPQGVEMRQRERRGDSATASKYRLDLMKRP
jgi:putative acetyltransferase